MSKHGTALSVGQFSEFSAAVIRNLPRDIDPNIALGWANNGEALSRVLREALCPLTSLDSKNRFRSNGEAILYGSTKSFNPHQYFNTRRGLRVSDEFRDQIISISESLSCVPAAELAMFDLNMINKPIIHADVRIELPPNHIFEDTSVFSAYLAEMIDRQPNGKEGDLLSDGNATGAFVRAANGLVCVVDVYWDKTLETWILREYPLNRGWYPPVHRYISSNC